MANLGWPVGTAGDVNNDGYSDVIVGAYGYNTYAGAAFVYYGSTAGLSSNPDWIVNGDSAEGGLGGAVASAGDVNGDGFSDVIIGVMSYLPDSDIDLRGGAYVYYGSATGLNLPQPNLLQIGRSRAARPGPTLEAL